LLTTVVVAEAEEPEEPEDAEELLQVRWLSIVNGLLSVTSIMPMVLMVALSVRSTASGI
jgi:hypothetical protein